MSQIATTTLPYVHLYCCLCTSILYICCLPYYSCSHLLQVLLKLQELELKNIKMTCQSKEKGELVKKGMGTLS